MRRNGKCALCGNVHHAAPGYAVFCPLWQVREAWLAMRRSVCYGRFGECGWLCGILPVMAGLGSVAGHAAFCLLWQVGEAWQSYLPPLGCGRGWKCRRQGRAAQCCAPAGTRMGPAGNLPMAHGLSAEVGGFAKIPSARGQARKMAKNEGASLRTDAARAKKGADRFQTTEMGG